MTANFSMDSNTQQTPANPVPVMDVGSDGLFGPPPLNPTRGLIFLHKRIIYPDTKTPAKMVVTCVRNGGIYYRFLGGGGHEYVTHERWPHVAASVPNKTAEERPAGRVTK